jgi:Domain of unknown function (DUF4287)
MTPENEPQQGMNGCLPDDALARSTGYTWNEWFAILDAQGADRTRAELAQFLRETHGLSLWWANTINVGYERTCADRVEPERRNGYQITTSKTFPVTVDRVFAAFVEPSGRERWLGHADLRLCSSQATRLARFEWQGGPSRVTVYFTDKGEKSSVKVLHGQLLTAGEAEALKGYWRERLTALLHVLSREAIPWSRP